ncbi:MAG: PKD domain-containing protein [Chitinophagales bacterium]|nr:PKD domain-containing protein [Chitinophagaceae bacterium]MCB9065525.1 PKD domain-containing protein [Chitinophagales bacterium]
MLASLKKTSILLLLTTILFAYGCKKENSNTSTTPTVNDPNDPNQNNPEKKPSFRVGGKYSVGKYHAIGDTLYFTLFNKESIQTLLWEFGDGTTSSEMEPTHIYTKEGDFKVRLKVNDSYYAHVTNYPSTTSYTLNIITPPPYIAALFKSRLWNVSTITVTKGTNGTTTDTAVHQEMYTIEYIDKLHIKTNIKAHQNGGLTVSDALTYDHTQSSDSLLVYVSGAILYYNIARDTAYLHYKTYYGKYPVRYEVDITATSK